MRHQTIAIIISTLLLISPCSAQNGNGPTDRLISMTSGFSVILRAPASIKTAVVGNPNLLDVVPQSDRILSLTAKAPGATNIILLDHDGAEVFSGFVSIAGRSNVGETHIVGTTGNIHNYITYRCNPTCTVIGQVKPAGINPLTGEEVIDPPVYIISPTGVAAPVQRR